MVSIIAATAPAAEAPAAVEEPAAEVKTSTAEKRKSRSADMLKKLQFWKKEKKETAVAA